MSVAAMLGVAGLALCWGLWLLLQRLLAFRKFQEIVDRIPGPPAIPLLGNTHQFQLDKTAFTYQLEAMTQKFRDGGLFRLWLGPRPLILLTKAKTAEVVLTSSKLITKSTNYDLLKSWLRTGLLTSTGEKWRRRRKLLTPTFHFSILNEFVAVHAEQAEILADRISGFARDQLPFNIYPYIGCCALDIICQTAMGVNVNAQRDSNSDYVRAVQRISEIAFKHERMPWLWLKPVFYLLGYGFDFDRCLCIVKGFTERVIADRSKELASGGEVGRRQRATFLDLLLQMKGAERLTDEDIAEETDTFMFEGHDTTASSMSWCVFMLGHLPHIQEKVFAEQEDIFGDSLRPPTAEDLKEMKFLERVVKETLRLYPSVPLFARRVTEDFQCNGYTVPCGSTALILPFLLHRDPEVFPEPERFDPDRFLTDDDAGRRHPFAYIPFSAGPRNCIGQKFALMEEKTVMSVLVRRFKIESIDSPEAARPVPDLVLRPPERILVRLTPRRADAS